MTTLVTEKLIAGLQQMHPAILDRGRAWAELYPPAKIDPVLYQNITVPVPLPMAMLLVALAGAVLAKPANEPFPSIDPAA